MSETQVPRGTPWLGVAGLMLLATLLAAAFVQVRQHALLNQTVQDQDDFTVLSLYQLEVEYLRLRERLKLAALAPASGGHDELQLRYDIFLSRIDLLKAAKARRMLGTLASTQDTVRALEVFVSRAEVYLGRDPRAPLSQAAATALATESERLAEPIHLMLIDATHHVAAQITARRDQVRRHNDAGLWLTVFLSAMVLAFAWIAWRQMRGHERRRAELESLADELRGARVAAEDANATKSAFLADISHELRTPLHGLRGMLGLVRDAPRDPRAGQWLATADESAAHLQHLLDDLLDLAKLEAGTLELAPQAVDLRNLIGEICSLMRPQAEAKGLELDAQIDAELPAVVQLDPTRVREVLFNLLQNAVTHSDAGSVRLRCGRVDDATGAPQLEFVVIDNGVGMDAAALGQLFQRHARAVDPTARRRGGAGLGLAISHRLARLMGGELEARSAPGAGSSFSLRCPMLPAQVPASAPTSAGAALARSLRVLVAEDHPVNRMYLGALLERLGHQAHQAEHGRQALEAVQEQSYDLVLMDVHMPVMDGVEATAAIRALPAVTQPRIVALTADVFADTRKRCLDAGIDEVATKPMSAASLSALLHRHFALAGPLPQDPMSPPTQGAASALQLLDPSAQADVRQTVGEQHCRAMYTGLFEQADHTTQRMREAMRQADVESLRRLAHAVKGASLNLGLPALADAAATLSAEAHAMAAPQLALAVQRFEEMVRATRSLCAAEGLIGE